MCDTLSIRMSLLIGKLPIALVVMLLLLSVTACSTLAPNTIAQTTSVTITNQADDTVTFRDGRLAYRGQIKTTSGQLGETFEFVTVEYRHEIVMEPGQTRHLIFTISGRPLIRDTRVSISIGVYVHGLPDGLRSYMAGPFDFHGGDDWFQISEDIVASAEVKAGIYSVEYEVRINNKSYGCLQGIIIVQ
jgi:hypothetical protein